MLFSNPQIAQLVNAGFEPVWQSVRPVPIVTIDFGSDRKITRTLHGNIATYVCTPSGHIIDVLPGLYTPRVFAERLMTLQRAARLAPKSMDEFAVWLAKRQEQWKHDVKKNDEKNVQKLPEVRDVTKTLKLEFPVILALSPPPPVDEPPSYIVDALGSPGELTVWNALVEDTRINDTARRRQISEFLVESGPVAPEAMTKWLYREVLDADIDDPWLGLKDLADASVFGSVEASSADRPSISR